jgi:hypothetical protein
MVRRIAVRLTDDLDHTELRSAAAAVPFSLDGTLNEIDLVGTECRCSA